MSNWTREVKSVAAFSIHDILSFRYLGLLHKIGNECKHSISTVYCKVRSGKKIFIMIPSFASAVEIEDRQIVDFCTAKKIRSLYSGLQKNW